MKNWTKAAVLVALALAAGPGRAQFAPSAQTLDLLATQARETVARESPDTVFPVMPVRRPVAGRMVIAHYMPIFPLSFDNKPAPEDYYARHYLSPEGEGGKFRSQRGYLRQRPLPVPVTPGQDYVAANLALEIARASRIGIDAFGVDLLSIDPQVFAWRHSLLMLDVARAVDPAFRIVPEPDMTTLGAADIKSLAAALTIFADHPSAYHLPDGRLLVMPFAAERKDALFWSGLVRHMAALKNPIALVLDYVDPASLRANAPISWGASVWGDRDPQAGERGAKYAALAKAAGIRRWFMPVAPQDARPKDFTFTEARNGEAFRSQWEAAIRTGAAGVHLITWNDYSETSEIAPSSATQYLFYDLTAYYVAAYKSGSRPAIRREALYYIYRTQVLTPGDESRGRGPAPHGDTALSNEVELMALLTAPGRLEIDLDGRTYGKAVPAGLQLLRVPARPGLPVFRLMREGKMVLQSTDARPIEAAPARHDATYGGGSTTRPVAGR